ncbi:MAG: ribose 1,5-bisphosphokinase, partial [Enterobacter sp.]|nr:ribose 1,5-bisphosphokinase [Enterobacter sp.]
MMGRLIWLMGPSGSGKDSLLSALRQQEHPQ